MDVLFLAAEEATATSNVILNGLTIIFTAIIVATANYIQSRNQKRDAERLAAETVTATKDAAKVAAKKQAEVAKVLVKKAVENGEKADMIHESLNGTGLLGEVKQLNVRITEHIALDDQRHDQNLTLLGRLVNAVGLKDNEPPELVDGNAQD